MNREELETNTVGGNDERVMSKQGLDRLHNSFKMFHGFCQFLSLFSCGYIKGLVGSWESGNRS